MDAHLHQLAERESEELSLPEVVKRVHDILDRSAQIDARPTHNEHHYVVNLLARVVAKHSEKETA